MNLIAISPGHYKIGTGACDLIDEVTEARKVVDRVAYLISLKNIGVSKIVDNISSSQLQNLNYLITEHNKKERLIDISVHFNSSGKRTNNPIGTEVLYFQDSIRSFASQVSQGISDVSGLMNRGAKKRDLMLLRKTNQPSIIIEVCFVNSVQDVEIYRKHFHAICQSIADCVVHFVAQKKNNAHVGQRKNVQHTLLSENSFTSPTLMKRIEALLKNDELVEVMIRKGIAEGAIHQNWLVKFHDGTITPMDILGINTLIIEKQLK